MACAQFFWSKGGVVFSFRKRHLLMKKVPVLSQLFQISLIAAACTTASSLCAQNVAVKITADEPNFDDLQSPELGGNTGKKAWKPKDWLEVEVPVEIETRPDTPDGYIDRLTVRWFVAVENKVDRNAAKFFLMEKSVTHVNVPVGEKFYLSCYISPATIKRLTGSDRAGKNAIAAVGGEINAPGAVSPARFTSKGDVRTPFWTSAAMQRSNKYPLLNKNETPFKNLWWDRYLEIAPDNQ